MTPLDHVLSEIRSKFYQESKTDLAHHAQWIVDRFERNKKNVLEYVLCEEFVYENEGPSNLEVRFVWRKVRKENG